MIWSYFYLLMGLLWFLDMVYLSSSCFRATPFVQYLQLADASGSDRQLAVSQRIWEIWITKLPVSPFLSSFYYNYYISLHSRIEGSVYYIVCIPILRVAQYVEAHDLCFKKKPLPCWISLQETGHHPSQGVLSPSHRSPLSKLRVRDELGGSKVMIDKPPNHGIIKVDKSRWFFQRLGLGFAEVVVDIGGRAVKIVCRFHIPPYPKLSRKRCDFRMQRWVRGHWSLKDESLHHIESLE